MMRKCCSFQFWLGLTLSLCLYVVIVMYMFNIAIHDTILRSMREYNVNICHNEGPPKKIMWYGVGNSFKGGVHNDVFRQCKCAQCEFVFPILDDKDFVKLNMFGPFDADAILMQACHMKNLQKPPVRKNNDQAFVFVDREPEPYTDENMSHDWMLRHFTTVFNWTLTYRRDSDLFLPYGEIIPASETEITQKQRNFDNIYKKKSRNVAWVVSHCPTRSKRMKYVRELQEYIDVDIYGRCGNLTIQEKGTVNFMDSLEFAYKFYLSFENSYHTDYVTEKLFDWFEKDIIVVVRGATNYTKIVPEGTIIDAADFAQPKDLAKYLIELGNDRKRYVEYLKRKTYYKVVKRKALWQHAVCQLCHMLHNVDAYRKSYDHIGTWWKHQY